VSTRRPLTLAELTAVLAPIGRSVAERSLSGGVFATVQAVELDDGSTVVAKTGVPDDDPSLLRYERSLLRAEIDFLERVAALPDVPSPRVLLTDFTRRHTTFDVMVTDLRPGVSWQASRSEMSPDSIRRAGETVGRILARLHTVTARRFGYPESGSGPGGATWPAAFDAMTEALLDDAVRWDVEVDADRVREAVRASTTALAQVDTPLMVHMDLWPGNVLVDPTTGEVTGVVDFERGLFADPLMDFVGAEPFLTGPLSPAPLAGYAAAGGDLPMDASAGTVTGFTVEADRRIALYRLYLTLLMTIEVGPRQYGWQGLGEYVDRLVRDRAVLLGQLGA
jgi:aminoglycoside phosphotransferase (APT) family kinase protein